MTSRKPLVMIDGISGQLPVGDTLEATLTPDAIELINTTGEDQPLGTPVVLKEPNEFALAQGTNRSKAEAIGLLQFPVSIGLTALIRPSGILAAPAENWQLVTEAEANLIPGAVYYLAMVAGKITNTPPTGESGYLVRLGRALSTTQFQINVEPPIGL